MANAAVFLLLLVTPMLSVLPIASLAMTQDFCVADLTMRETPVGYPCKPPASVTADDFHNAGLAAAGPVLDPFQTGLATAFVTHFPGLNGLGLGATRVDIHPGGVVPLHTHPAGSELLFVMEGTVSAGFISGATNTVYVKTVGKGELFVFPQCLLHFQYNVGNTTAVAFAVYSSHMPGLQAVDFALFKSDLPSAVAEKITFVGDPEVKRLKAFFGGSG
jgi:quercetin dioxygenase-like cupin family protein